MKHHNGCTGCIHNKALDFQADWYCVESERQRIEAKYRNSVFNCFDYEAAPDAPAPFKVGDRVKIDHVDASLSPYEGHQQLVGKVGRVVSVDTEGVCPIAVQVGGALHPGGLRCACFAESELRLVKTTARRAPMPPHTISEEGWEYADWAHDFYGDR